jgi:hypothetical protein
VTKEVKEGKIVEQVDPQKPETVFEEVSVSKKPANKAAPVSAAAPP